MNLQNMEYLIEISNCGSISAAAKHLFVTQPYLSKVLRETEKEYGLTIFTRGKNGIIPTESGRLFLDMSRDLIEHAKHFKTTFKEHSEAYRLRVSSSSCSHASDAFIRMVNSLADTPFRFFYREMTGNEVIEDVYTNRADIGFIMYPAHKADKIQEILTFRHLKARPLFQSPTQFFCRVGHPILKELDNLTPEKLYQYNFVLYPSESTKTRAAESVYNDKTLAFRLMDKEMYYHMDRASESIVIDRGMALHKMIRLMTISTGGQAYLNFMGNEFENMGLDEIGQRFLVQQRLGLLVEEGLVGRTAALGNEEEFILHAGVAAINVDLRREVRTGILLLGHRERHDLRIAQVAVFVSLVHAFGNAFRIVGARIDVLALVADADGCAGVLARGEFALGRNDLVEQHGVSHELVVVGGLGIVEDVAQLLQVGGTQVERHVGIGGLRQLLQPLGVDFQNLAAVALHDFHVILGQQTVLRGVLAHGERLLIDEFWHNSRYFLDR